jgi:hypothetical protein
VHPPPGRPPISPAPPVRTAPLWSRHECVDEPKCKVARQFPGHARRPAERQIDGQHQPADPPRHDCTRYSTGDCRTDAESQYRGPHAFGRQIRRPVANRWPGTEHPTFHCRITGRFPMSPKQEPDQNCTAEPTCQLCPHVNRDPFGREQSPRRQRERHRWVDVSAADRSRQANRDAHRDRRANSDSESIPTHTVRPSEPSGRHFPVCQENEQHRPYELGGELAHSTPPLETSCENDPSYDLEDVKECSLAGDERIVKRQESATGGSQRRPCRIGRFPGERSGG